MSIELFEAQGVTKAKQTFTSPTIYLDHWAIRLFSDDPILQERLVTAILGQGGTLLLSNFTFAEFARNDDRRHALAAEKFIDRLLPNIYFTDCAFDKLHEQEQYEPDNIQRFWPSSDLPQLKLFVERAQGIPKQLTMHGFISLARDNFELLETVTKETLQMIREGLEIYREDINYVKAARKILPTSNRTRTFVIMAELMREFILDNTLAISDNDIMDMLHAAMPINCCDFVLLDGAWANRVSKMKQRIKHAKSIMPLAKCYSPRNNGVENFLNELTSKSIKPDSVGT